jgi:hypothetical protein
MVALATTVLISGGLGLAGGIAQAQPVSAPLIHWCPGDPWQSLAPPPADWNMNVCHDMKTVPDPSQNPPWRVVETAPWTPPPGCPPWATIFSGLLAPRRTCRPKSPSPWPRTAGRGGPSSGIPGCPWPDAVVSFPRADLQ